jgi:hypothetical protein
MKNFLTIKKLLVIVFIIFGLSIFKETKAGAQDNVSGWSWSENIGWVSFNCTNEGSCASVDYGVNISTSTGVFSGYSWSENIGWISFNESDLSGCPSGACQASFNPVNNEVSGWAKALSLTDGWIRLRDTNYGVFRNPSNSELEGYAWSDQIGWISFNCQNTGVCGISNYQVIIFGGDTNPPTVEIDASPPEAKTTWQDSDACVYISSCEDSENGCSSYSYKFLTYSSNPGFCPDVYGSYSSPNPGGSCNPNEQVISSHVWACGAATDMAGNPGFSDPLEFMVDEQNPLSDFVSPSPSNLSWQGDDFSLWVADSDSGGSGLRSGNGCEYFIIDFNTGANISSSRPCGTYNFNVPVGTSTGDICEEDTIGQVGEPSCHVETIAYDNAGNSITVARNFRIDQTNPEVGGIFPLSATQGQKQLFSAALVDPIGSISGTLGGCWFYEDNWGVPVSGVTVNIEEVIYENGVCENGENCTVSVNYAPPLAGDHEMRFACRDAVGNIGWGNPVTVSVSASTAPVITSFDYYTARCSTPYQQCQDQFNCCLEPTTQNGCCVGFDIEAFDPDTNPLTYYWDFDDGGTDTTHDPSEDTYHHYSLASNYTVSVDVSDGSEVTHDFLDVGVSSPTISVSLTADPSFGLSPLINVNLRAIVSGSMFGSIVYLFDCTDDGTWDVIIPPQSTEDYTAFDVCNYNIVGNYTARVLVFRGVGSAQDIVNIDVVDGTCVYNSDPLLNEQTLCTSAQGCTHTIYCQPDNTWPECPTDECTINDTQSCGSCGTQICQATCTWGSCTEGGECPADQEDSPDCPCPPDSCYNLDYYDFPDFGDCSASCVCNIGTGASEPCEPSVFSYDLRCDQEPVAQISCYPQGCVGSAGSCTGYTGSPFCLKNDSIDPDGEDNIKNSIWTITGPVSDTSDCLLVSGTSICNWTLPFSYTSGDYNSKLEVEDLAGATSTDFQPFAILQDAIAEFRCSLDAGTLFYDAQECEGFSVSEGEVVYFIDGSSPSELGGPIIQRNWTFEDGTPPSDIGNNSTTTLSSFTTVDVNSGRVTLDIMDNAGRTASKSYQVKVTIPLPEWHEVAPL